MLRYRDLDGKLISKTFKTRSEAEEYAIAHSAEKRIPADMQFSGVERADIIRIKALCAKYGYTLPEAADILESQFRRGKWNVLQIDSATKRYYDHLEAKKVRPDTLRSYKDHVDRFAKWYKSASHRDDLSTFSREDAQNYINMANSKGHVQSALRAFWTYLCNSRAVPENVFKGLKIPRVLKDKAPISIMSVEATVENLAAIRKEFKPLYALMTFAGIRPEELISDPKKNSAKRDLLSFSDIDFKNRRITVRSAAAKTRAMRIIEGLPENIWSWLEPVREWKAVYPAEIPMLRPRGARTTTTNIYQQWRIARGNLPHKVEHDALRHSFASYAYYVLGVEHAVEVLGHDYSTYKKHYKGLATKADSEAYFKIFP